MPRNSKCVAGIAATVVAGVILAFGRTDHNRFHLGTEMALEQQKPLRVVCVSDLHGVHLDGSLGELPDGDVLIVAGDIELTSARDARAFKAWLNQQPHRHKIVTFGNMDSWAAATPTEEVEAALAPATVLLDSSADIEGYRFVGSAHTPEFYGVFQLPSQAGAEEHWQALLPPSGRVDVLVTHGPPHGWGDLTRGRHVGDRALLAAVQAMNK